MIRRRRPVAVYRVIDEEELLGEPAPSEHVVHPSPVTGSAARQVPWRPLALAGAAALAAVAALLVTGAPAALPREHAARPAPVAPASAPVHHTLATLPARPRPRHHRRPPARRRPSRPPVLERAPRAVVVPPAPPDPAAEFGFER